MPGHVAGKVAMGASRNLVIRRYDGRHTEENIREDLDHIHNLVVIKVEFHGGNCYVSLNSVHNAIYARMCMMSRGYVFQHQEFLIVANQAYIQEIQGHEDRVGCG